MKTALIGYGRWGKKLKKYLEANKNFYLVSICNSKTDLKKVFPRVGAVIIATPIDTHYKLVKQALENNCHVFCEKPLTTKTKECLELKKLAKEKGLALCVDYTWTFSPTLKKAKKKVENLEICFKRPSVDSIWNLKPHILSIVMMFKAGCVFADSGIGKKITMVKVDGKDLKIDREKDNLKYAIQYFYDVIIGKEKSNVDLAIEITKRIGKK